MDGQRRGEYAREGCYIKPFYYTSSDTSVAHVLRGAAPPWPLRGSCFLRGWRCLPDDEAGLPVLLDVISSHDSTRLSLGQAGEGGSGTQLQQHMAAATLAVVRQVQPSAAVQRGELRGRLHHQNYLHSVRHADGVAMRTAAALPAAAADAATPTTAAAVQSHPEAGGQMCTDDGRAGRQHIAEQQCELESGAAQAVCLHPAPSQSAMH